MGVDDGEHARMGGILTGSEDRPISVSAEVAAVDPSDTTAATTDFYGKMSSRTGIFHTQGRHSRSCLIVKSVEESLHSVGIKHQSRSRHKEIKEVVTNDDNTKSRVTFLIVEVREYECVLGDNPSVSSGPPVSIGWEYNSTHSLVSVDNYENMKNSRKTEAKRLGTMLAPMISQFDRERL